MKSRRKLNTLFIALLLFILNCSSRQDLSEDQFYRERKAMVDLQIKGRGIHDNRVLSAMMSVPRHKFVPEKSRNLSYADRPLPIGYKQTISQPYVVAYMTQILDPSPDQRVLEIGTGSGYQAAILSKLYKQVYTVEIIGALGEEAKKVFEQEGYKNISYKTDDGYKGWKEHSPFDAIIVTCAPEDIPKPLIDQLAEGGKMVIPVGTAYQTLYLLEKKNGKIHKTATLPVMFVPMERE